MTVGYQRFRSAVEFISSAAIGANSYSGGAQTTFDTNNGSKSGNAEGAFGLQIEVNITALSGDSSCAIYQQAEQHDGAGTCKQQLMGRIGGINNTGKYTTTIYDIAERGKITIKAGKNGFTASGSMRAMYPSDV